MSDENKPEETPSDEELNLEPSDLEPDKDTDKSDDTEDNSESGEDSTDDTEDEELDEDGKPIKKDDKPKKYTKERFDGLMSKFNKKIDDLEKDLKIANDKLTELESDKTDGQDEKDEVTAEEDAIVQRALAKDPVYQAAKGKYEEEKNVDQIVAESEILFTKLTEKDKTQDFTKKETKEKYYKLAAELSIKFDTPFSVYSAHAYEKEMKAKGIEVIKTKEIDDKRKKDADLKPKGTGGEGITKFDPNQTETEMWDGVREDLKS